MKTLQWTMEEVFYFPEEIGVPEEGGAVKVNAGFSENRTEDAVRLSGIYHVAAQVNFAEGDRAAEFSDEAVFVDDVELEGNSGYFEYAVPLYIDLPPEVETPLTIEATDVSARTSADGALAVKWNVTCTYGEKSDEVVGAIPEPTQTVVAAVQEPAPAPTVVAAVSEPASIPTVAEVKEPVPAAKAEVHVRRETEVAIHDSSSWNGHDDVLSYIATLPDEWATTTFRSNDVFVQDESEAY